MRIYGTWAGSKGSEEDPTRCIVEVPDSQGWIAHQCFNKRSKGINGLLCGIHANIETKGYGLRIPEDK